MITNVDRAGTVSIASPSGLLRVWVDTPAEGRFSSGSVVQVGTTVQPVRMVPVSAQAAASPAPAASVGSQPGDYAVIVGRITAVDRDARITVESPRGASEYSPWRRPDRGGTNVSSPGGVAVEPTSTRRPGRTEVNDAEVHPSSADCGACCRPRNPHGGPRAATAQGTGTLEVTVKHNGAPVVEIVKVNKDTQVCGTEARLQKVALGPNKGLANGVVSVATGTDSGAKAATTEPTIDQKGCKFVPHVVAMQPGEIEILNSDGVLHNFHSHSAANPVVNKAQPRFKKVMTVKFETPEFIKVTCDVHSWMLGWIAVLPTPYFGVTGPEGVVKIANVPAGEHKVEVWHEVLGKQVKEVEVKAGEVTRVSVEVKGNVAAPR